MTYINHQGTTQNGWRLMKIWLKKYDMEDQLQVAYKNIRNWRSQKCYLTKAKLTWEVFSY